MDYINGIYCFVGQHAKQQRRKYLIATALRVCGQLLMVTGLIIAIGLVW